MPERIDFSLYKVFIAGRISGLVYGVRASCGFYVWLLF